MNTKGLYDSRFEHDACGVGFIADLKNRKTHTIVRQGIEILENLEHRGAVGAEANSGDGAGIQIQIPHHFFEKVTKEVGFSIPPMGEYGVGIVFLPPEDNDREEMKKIFTQSVERLGQKVLGWRSVPVENSSLGSMVKEVEPVMEQVFIKKGADIKDEQAFERKLFIIRKLSKKEIVKSDVGGKDYYYTVSLSARTITYKGMLTAPQVNEYFPDLADEDMKSAIALVHSRFSTNTFPSWPLAQPFRYLAHNGEINTLRGNINWMRAREAIFESGLFTKEEIGILVPVIDDTESDSAILDNAVELLTLAGRSLPHVMAMLIPEAWSRDEEMSDAKRAFYEFHATLMEPWDGPASIAFTDGNIIGATLDRNGLRPSRYAVTEDDILVMGSEAGVLTFPAEKIVKKGWLQPGRMFVARLDEGRIVSDKEIKNELATARPYADWLKEGKIVMDQLDAVKSPHQPDHDRLTHRQVVYGYTLEDLDMIIRPMAEKGNEPIGSMGSDTPLAVLSDMPQNLFNYFYQLFAQVTNPPIDPIREEAIMSLVTFIGGEGHILHESEEHCRVIEMPQPVLTNDQLEQLKQVNKFHFMSHHIDTLFETGRAGGKNLKSALDRICKEAATAVEGGCNIIILSDRGANANLVPIPSLLAVGAVHHHLIRIGKRSKCGIVVETGVAREVHHFALLLGYGASAVNPFLAFETIEDMRTSGLFDEELEKQEAKQNFCKAVDKGLLKIMSKMGISTLRSYIGAQIFEAVGLDSEIIDLYFTGTPSRIGGIGLGTLEEECLRRHAYAYPDGEVENPSCLLLEEGGNLKWRARGEAHTFNPSTIEKLQKATRTGDYEKFVEFEAMVDNPERGVNRIRDLFEFSGGRSIDINEVEPETEIVKRFFTGAMSFGSISKEAHETLAVAMNRLGGRSNTGEGGEDADRFTPRPDGDSARSAIKQVASGRFGVTSNYLVNADELQIKMAQGAKPGEGGHLPGSKVDQVIARVRHSTPGVGLISPPPHHDIYSIEDLAQLIFDLKNANDRARINVKLVAEVGVGTIAAGVAKGHSEAILISGHDGGTGASPVSSIKHAGLPWELGVAETHQVLVRNRLRSRIVLQTDGRLMTGRDIAIAALLGAEEWGCASTALIIEGCIMMRKCQMNSCPVGVATQDPELRKNFTGNPDHLVNFFTFIARSLRKIMADLGFRTINEMVGRADRLCQNRSIKHWKAAQLDLSPLFVIEENPKCKTYCTEKQEFGLEHALDRELIRKAAPALQDRAHVTCEIDIANTNRTFGTLLSAEISRNFGEAGLPEDTIHVKANGSAGQSFGAFSAKGLTIELEGEANDYFCKGLSGGKVILYPPVNAKYESDKNIIVGNVAFYGATAGESYISGIGGERFCVRNSGARVVVEKIGDNGCEYMTGGRVVILGGVGKNFAAGMSGGIAYILDRDGMSKKRINKGMVELEKLEDRLEIEEVKEMISRHYFYTESRFAKSILDDFDTNVEKFIKVMPIDYKRALQERAKEIEEESLSAQPG